MCGVWVAVAGDCDLEEAVEELTSKFSVQVCLGTCTRTSHAIKCILNRVSIQTSVLNYACMETNMNTCT